MAKIEMAKSSVKPTTLNDLKKYANGAIVEIPPFAEDMPVFVKLKRPSMMSMIADGLIPNQLLSVAETMFMNGASDSNIPIKDMREVVVCMCKACMVEPTYQDVIDAGLELTDEQMLFIFNYSQIGVNALRSFRG